MIQLTVHALLVRNAQLYPDRIAVEDEHEKLTHQDLLQRSIKVANALMSLGCQPGSRVAVLSRNSIAMMEIMCACELFGFIAVPLNHRLATPEIGKILQDCTPTLLVGEVFFSPLQPMNHKILIYPSDRRNAATRIPIHGGVTHISLASIGCGQEQGVFQIG